MAGLLNLSPRLTTREYMYRSFTVESPRFLSHMLWSAAYQHSEWRKKNRQICIRLMRDGEVDAARYAARRSLEAMSAAYACLLRFWHTDASRHKVA